MDGEIVTTNGTHFQVVPIPNDGSCLFHCISYILHGDCMHSLQIRSSIIEHIVQNWTDYHPFTVTSNGSPYTTREHYRTSMSIQGSYGATSELMAAGTIFPLCIHIYQNGNLISKYGNENHQAAHIRFMGPTLSGHFDVLEPMSTPATFFHPRASPRKRKPVMAHTRYRNTYKRRKENQGRTSLPSQTSNVFTLKSPTTAQCPHIDSPEVTQSSLHEETHQLPQDHRNLELPTFTSLGSQNFSEQPSTVPQGTRANLPANGARVTRRKRKTVITSYRQRSAHKQIRENERLTSLPSQASSVPPLPTSTSAQCPEINSQSGNQRGPRTSSRNRRPSEGSSRSNLYEEPHPDPHDASSSPTNSQEQTPFVSQDTSYVDWANKPALNYNHHFNYVNKSYIGKMDTVCGSCCAKKFKAEPLGLCCKGGKVQLPPFETLPILMHRLLHNLHPLSTHFLSNIRSYNSCFNMTSFMAKTFTSGFMPTFKVQGQVYHCIGNLEPAEGITEKFLQIYFVSDEEKQTELRCNISNKVRPKLVSELQAMLHESNTYVQQFKSALSSVAPENNIQVVIRANKKPANAHPGRFNKPTTADIGIVIAGQTFEKRDILLTKKDDTIKRISETHVAYDALQYPLIFCRGEDMYATDVPQRNPQTKLTTGKNVSALQFYSYYLMVRDVINPILMMRKLFCQYVVDMFAKIDSERLSYIRNNQQTLRVDNYANLQDAIGSGDADPSNLGMLLPSSFTGSPRYMFERTQDAMMYVRKHGTPDLFITFTCNPEWPEISENLLPRQLSSDRPDLVARVFHLKLKKLMLFITKGCAFGSVLCHMYTVEWQKRGLPHAHILIWLRDRIDPNNIDSAISAELPDPDKDPQLYNIVKRNMIHGPCGAHNSNAPCMQNDRRKCSKGYPREFKRETVTGADSYPKYRRRSPSEGGFTATIKGQRIDNTWVVPYNPVLSRIFDAHINVEYCASVKAIKYICKYVNKGTDQAAFTLEQNHDEIMSYLIGRYISSAEASYRIFAFPIHERSPPVVKLAVHLENGQRVYFNDRNLLDRVTNPKKTTLMAFFELCLTDTFAKTLLYPEVPSYYIFQNNKFVRRKQGALVEEHPGVRKHQTLGRVYTVHPNNSECYYLRLLLHEVRGPTSFAYLKTVNGVVEPTFQSACRSLGLLADDSHWDYTLQDAAVSYSPNKLRQLFVTMLAFCNLGDPLTLWNTHKHSMCEDISRRFLNQYSTSSTQFIKDYSENECLIELQQALLSLGGLTLAFFGLPIPEQSDPHIENREYIKETSYDTGTLLQNLQIKVPLLNAEQTSVYNEVTNSVEKNLGNVYFLDAPGGTGKTFLINLLLSKVRSQKCIAIAVASSGIAATLLQGGRTAHSAFKLPLALNYIDTPSCSIKKQDHTAAVLRDCRLIVWDECTMSHKSALEAVDRCLRDLRGNNTLMGGLTVLLAGDFRQTLPVIPRGTSADQITACFKSSVLWPKIKSLSLTTNMRVQLSGNQDSADFSELLMTVGNGTIGEPGYKTSIPHNLCDLVHTIDDLTTRVYPDLNDIGTKTSSWFKERAILAPRNDTVNSMNNILLQKFQAQHKTYMSVNTVLEDEDAVRFPTEFLNSLTPPGIPQHELRLKIGAPIILLRNLQPPELCNGTRLRVTGLTTYVLEAVVITGCAEGKSVLIPRIPLIPSDFPIQFKRLQFPVKLSFAMTINKAQGQSLKMAGVDLREDCFSHGQLYVACSRVSSPRDLIILQPDGMTTNIVYKNVLT